MAWRPNNALQRLIDQWKAGNPGKEVVYTIADDAHGSTSDHQVDPDGTVDAGDFMPGDNVTQAELDEFAETLRLNRDRRIKYVIRRQRIFYGAQGPTPFQWRKHTGEYHGHCHVSTREDYEDDGRDWDLNNELEKWTMNVSLAGFSLPKLTFGDDDNKMAGYNYVSRAQILLNYVVNSDLTVDGVYGPKMKAAVVKLAATGNGSTVALAEWSQLYGLSKAAS